MKENISAQGFENECRKKIRGKNGVEDGSLATLQRMANKAPDVYEMAKDAMYVIEEFRKQLENEKNNISNEKSWKENLKYEGKALFSKEDTIQYLKDSKETNKNNGDRETEIGG